MPTVFITGCSTGFGQETARHFLSRGWQVIATMRHPIPDGLPASDALRILPLDVTNPDSIARAVEEAGPIDALVNNAGIGWLNALEATPMDVVRQIFETNTFGTIAVTQAVLPQFRERKAGVVVNITSSVTMLPLDLLSVYTASKAAVNALTEVLALEMKPFNVRVRLVLPGRAPGTKFGENAHKMLASRGGFPDAYRAMIDAVFARFAAAPQDQITRAEDVAEAVWRAVTEPDTPFRLPAGADAVALAARN